jgi:hypothetical protein
VPGAAKKRGQLGQLTAISMLTNADKRMQQQIKEREIKIAALESEIRPLFEQVQALARTGKGKGPRARALLKQIAPLESRLNKQVLELQTDRKILATASDITEEVDNDEARAEIILALKGATPHIGARSTKGGETLTADDIDDIFSDLSEARKNASSDGGTIRSALSRHLQQTDLDASIDSRDNEDQTDESGLSAMMQRLGGRFGVEEEDEEDEVVPVPANAKQTTASTTSAPVPIPQTKRSVTATTDNVTFPTHPDDHPPAPQKLTTSRSAIAVAVETGAGRNKSRTRHIIMDDDNDNIHQRPASTRTKK